MSGDDETPRGGVRVCRVLPDAPGESPCVLAPGFATPQVDHGVMKAVERAARAELRGLPAPLRSSALAKVAVDLARRLDEGPADRSAAMLARELRLVTGELRRRARGDVGGEAEAFLEAVSNPAFRGPGD